MRVQIDMRRIEGGLRISEAVQLKVLVVIKGQPSGRLQVSELFDDLAVCQ